MGFTHHRLTAMDVVYYDPGKIKTSKEFYDKSFCFYYLMPISMTLFLIIYDGLYVA